MKLRLTYYDYIILRQLSLLYLRIKLIKQDIKK